MVSRSLYKSTAQVSYMGKQESGGLPGITLSYNLLPIILKELLVNNGEYAVELYESGSSTGNGSWKLVKQGSPGMWRDFEMDIGKTGDVVESPVIVAISMGYSEGMYVFQGNLIWQLWAKLLHEHLHRMDTSS